MTKLLSMIIAATFAAASLSVMAQDKKPAAKKPTAEECKKDPKMAGSEKPAEKKK
jgi:Ni/Co efflux regulator RcnB